jgi:hypothetical protein
MNLGGAAKGFSALTGSTEEGSGAVVMTAGCRSPFAIRALLELGDAEGWTDLRTARRASSAACPTRSCGPRPSPKDGEPT